MTKVAIDLVVIVVVLVTYYKVVLVVMRDRLVPPTVPWVLRHFQAARSRPVSDIENVVTLAYSVVLQILLFFLLGLITSYQFSWLWPETHQPLLLLFALVLGVAEMVLCSFFGLLVIKLSDVIPQVTNPLAHWEVVLNSGWMRLFNTTTKLLPLPAAITVVLLYVGVEELIIRSITLGVLLPLGAVPAIVISTAIFAGYQVFNLPSWRVAVFPVIGALVIGPIHGLLYIAVPNVWPLVVAHVAYFTVVAMTFRR